MSVIVVQTCDGSIYKDLLDTTEAHHRGYCKAFGYDYYRYDGVKRGFNPWHSSFNRIYLLEEALKDGVHDWMLYMDADAIIYDTSKSVDKFLDPAYAVIVCRGVSDEENTTYDFNIGVAFYNLKHPNIAHIVAIWKKMYESVPDHVLQSEQDGCFHINGRHVDDQAMLQQIMHHVHKTSLKIYRGHDFDAFNYDGPFIKQLMRAPDTTVAKRSAQMVHLIESTHNIKYVNVDIVVARYNEDPTWILSVKDNLPQHIILRNIFIYNKGDTLNLDYEQYPNVAVVLETLPNLGRESNTYIQHILKHYDDQADVTLFVQGKIDDHCILGLSPIAYVHKMITTAIDSTIGMSWNAYPWQHGTDFNFRLEQYYGALSRSEYNYGQWFGKFIGKFPNNSARHLWYQSGLFAVQKHRIVSRSMLFYRRLLGELTAPNPEQEHYMERSWFYILQPNLTRHIL